MKSGISLILLVITIIVIIIIAGAVILNLVTDTPVDKTNDSTFKSNVQEYSAQLTMAISDEYLKNENFNTDTFYAYRWDGVEDPKGTIKEFIKSMKAADGQKFEIQKGKLVYVGSDVLIEEWLAERGIENGDITGP